MASFPQPFPLMKCVTACENMILPSLVGGIAMFATPGIEDPGSPDALAAGGIFDRSARSFTNSGALSQSSTRC